MELPSNLIILQIKRKIDLEVKQTIKMESVGKELLNLQVVL